MWIEYYVLASGVGGTTGPDMIARHSPPLLGRAVAGDCGLVNISKRAEGCAWDRDIRRELAVDAASSRTRPRHVGRRVRSTSRPSVAMKGTTRCRRASAGHVWVRRPLVRWHRRGRAQSSVTIRRAALRRALACYLAVPRQRLFWDRVTGSVALSPAMVTAPRRESVPMTVADIPRGNAEEGPTALSSAGHMSVIEPACPELNVHAQPWFRWAASVHASGSWSVPSQLVLSRPVAMHLLDCCRIRRRGCVPRRNFSLLGLR